MRKKYLLMLFIFTLLTINFVFVGSVSAKNLYDENDDYTCKYKYGSKKAGFYLSSKSPDVYYSDDSGYDDDIENWEAPLSGTTTNGDLYYYAGDCPKYLILVIEDDWSNSEIFFIASENELEQIKKAIKKKYDIAKLYVYDFVSKKETPKPEDPEENPYSSCQDFKSEEDCVSNKYYSCLWNKEYGYCNVDNLQYVACGEARDIPEQLPKIISFVINVIKIAVPIILVFVSMITLVKAVMSSNEDDIKKAQKSLIKKVIAAAIVFFVVAIVQLVMSLSADVSDTDSISSCIDCFLSNDCSEDKYYKTNVNGEYVCRKVENGAAISCRGE